MARRVLLGLALALALGGCGGGKLATVRIVGDRTGGVTLGVLPYLDGRDAMVRRYPADTAVVEMLFPEETQGLLEVTVGSFTAEKCIVAFGQTSRELPRQGDVQLTVPLGAIPPKCN